MSLFHPQIVDARGKRLALLGPLGAEQRRRRREIQRRLDAARTWTRRQIAIAAVVFLIVVMLGGSTIPTILFFELPMWLAVATIIPLGLLPPATMLLLDQRLFSSRYRDAYIGAGMCPSCGYDLLVVAIEADESRVCPECGGAWRVE